LFHSRIGYVDTKAIVIPNGVDTNLFKPDEAARAWLAREIGGPADAPVISMVASVRPEKDHLTFIRAAELLHRSRPDVRFVFCGHGASWDNAALAGKIARAGMKGQFHLLGVRHDVNRVMAGSSVLTSASVSEAFPCVICEAMACGTVCVVTDVGDSAKIVGDCGLIVPPCKPQSLADSWGRLLNMDAAELAGLRGSARRRIETCFSLALAVDRYQELYKELVHVRSTPCSCSAVG